MSTSLEALANAASAEGAGTRVVDLEVTRVRIGLGIVAMLVGLIVLAGIAIVTFAIVTFPASAEELKQFLGSTAVVAQDSHDRRHSAWLGEVKDLVQLWIVALLIPLVTTVIGYIFGKSVGESQD